VKSPSVYIMASGRNGTLYIGVTSDLVKRVWQHREGIAEGFTKDHDVKLLVWYEQHETMESAISREKAMKKWLRKWKLDIIEKMNPQWNDLWPEIIGEWPLSTIATVAAIPAPVAVPVPPAVPTPPVPLVIPANAGIQPPTPREASEMRCAVDYELDSRLRGNDGVGGGA